MIKLKEKYNSEVISEMRNKFKLDNVFEVPRIKKVVVNAGIGKFTKDSSLVKDVVESMTIITGQKPLMTKARLSIAGFKLREGQEVGIKTTLRGQRMWDFLDRLVNAALPRVRDFQGIKSSSIDADGNLNIGIKEHMIFPEIVPENVRNTIGFQITVVTDVNDRERNLEMFRMLKFPIAK